MKKFSFKNVLGFFTLAFAFAAAGMLYMSSRNQANITPIEWPPFKIVVRSQGITSAFKPQRYVLRHYDANRWSVETLDSGLLSGASPSAVVGRILTYTVDPATMVESREDYDPRTGQVTKQVRTSEDGRREILAEWAWPGYISRTLKQPNISATQGGSAITRVAARLSLDPADIRSFSINELRPCLIAPNGQKSDEFGSLLGPCISSRNIRAEFVYSERLQLLLELTTYVDGMLVSEQVVDELTILGRTQR